MPKTEKSRQELNIEQNGKSKFATHSPTPGFSLLIPVGEIQLQNHFSTEK